jgi:cytosine/adenosine deaminase-related metal-dependent hydrolase
MGTCSDELVLAAKDIADRAGVIFNQHQSFARSDAAADDARLGCHPLVHYAKIGALGPNCLFTHMNVIRDDELDAIRASGMAVTWCLTSSMSWGAGGTFHGRHDEMHRLGVNVGLGCDSGNSALRFDLTQQAVLAVLTAREKRLDRAALKPTDALEMLTISAARGIGLGSLIGSLEGGKRADLVVRSRDLPEAQPELEEVQSLVLSQASKSIDTVFVDGELVVRNGHSMRVDEGVVYARLRDSARRILGRVGVAAPSEWPRVD